MPGLQTRSKQLHARGAATSFRRLALLLRRFSFERKKKPWEGKGSPSTIGIGMMARANATLANFGSRADDRAHRQWCLSPTNERGIHVRDMPRIIAIPVLGALHHV